MNDIASHLTAILGRLGQAVAAFVALQLRGPEVVWLGTRCYVAKPQPNQRPALPSETWIQLIHRINRITQRFRALFARYQAGTLPALRPSRAGSHSKRQPETRQPKTRLPAERGWINGRIPAAAPCAGAIEYLLNNTPQMQEFVQAVPQAGRMLRPLCRMLAITPPAYLCLPERPRAAPKPAPQPPTPAHPTSTPDRPLPPEIRAAARAWKKYDR